LARRFNQNFFSIAFLTPGTREWRSAAHAPCPTSPYDYLLKPLRGVELLDGFDRCLAAAVEAHLKK